MGGSTQTPPGSRGASGCGVLKGSSCGGSQVASRGDGGAVGRLLGGFVVVGAWEAVVVAGERVGSRVPAGFPCGVAGQQVRANRGRRLPRRSPARPPPPLPGGADLAPHGRALGAQDPAPTRLGRVDASLPASHPP